MSEKRYLVPEGMLRAAGYAFMRCLADGKYLNAALEAALRWQSENPIVPTNGQLWACEMAVSGQGKGPFEGCSAVIAEWQRRMYLAPGSGVSEEIAQAICEGAIPSNPPVTRKGYDAALAEMFRRGQKSKEEA